MDIARKFRKYSVLVLQITSFFVLFGCAAVTKTLVSKILPSPSSVNASAHVGDNKLGDEQIIKQNDGLVAGKTIHTISNAKSVNFVHSSKLTIIEGILIVIALFLPSPLHRRKRKSERDEE